MTEVTEGTVDVLDRNISGDDLEWIAKANSNGKLYGSDINTSFTSDKKFSYVGINAKNVRVANKSESEQSKALRKAIASAISAQRIQRAEELAGKVKILNYPYTSESWLSPNTGDEDYNRAYSDTIDGEEIYNDDMTDEDKRIAVKDAATKYLEKQDTHLKTVFWKVFRWEHLKHTGYMLKMEEKYALSDDKRNICIA